MNRQDYWREKGYTQEQIENHLKFERYKAKLSRERRKKNNEKNTELIKQIKGDLLGKIFEENHCTIKVFAIRPTVDGTGFWIKTMKTFKDGSSGAFRDFFHFDEYEKEEFIHSLIG